MATAQARLLDDHQFKAEAEEAFRLATQICPSSPETVFSYTGLLASQKRFAEAVSVVETAVKLAPNNEQFRGLLQALSQAAGRN
jgi:hypothetical protein